MSPIDSGYLSATSQNALNSYYAANQSNLTFLSSNLFNTYYTGAEASSASTGLSSMYQGFGMTYNPSINYNYLNCQATDIHACSIPRGDGMFFDPSCGASIIANLFNASPSVLSSTDNITQQRLNYYS